MEKNWGRAFPKAWLWAQGVKAEGGNTEEEDDGPRDDRQSVALVLSYGEALEGNKDDDDYVIACLLVSGLLCSRSRPSATHMLTSSLSSSVGIYAHFVHYRDEQQGIAWDFKPDNSIMSLHHVDSCQGRASFVLHGFEENTEIDDGQKRYVCTKPRCRLKIWLGY